MTGEQEPEFRRWIRNVLSQLSWDADRQLEHVRSLKVDVDELALEFDDALHLAQAKVHEGLLSQEAYQALLPVDAKLSHMTEHGAELWTGEAVATAPAWEELRTIARQAHLDFDWKSAG
ncbi:hypothetical protein ETD86_48785 [Nonomuraea turkmeniaca]|uniref:Uncharacterized protein n=1 Tax=Nonomuraea turkmeniaca TaxID=103838 RepID=A0A5S4EX19_9ACTN|nr:hypothetical protein [Nonomuraea turkmeniaca]TMR08212.1 hypothetical protein ETD86_48785 [Nonomuraea turkmeniaca]